ncbi:MAG: ABC transporter permease [Parasporobacterium sp.]|nr:ABC transporter permease [Parasporobacterium sp.]
MKTLLDIVKQNISHRGQIWNMAVNDQKLRFAGSDLGLFWALAKPMMYIVVFYVAISIGFRAAKDIPGIVTPYFLWLAVGLISFFYMRDMILGGASCYRRYKNYIKHNNTPVSIYPTVIGVSFMLIHLFMVGIAILLSILLGCPPNIYWLQLPFYMALSFIFAVLWSMATGLIAAVFSDFYNLLQVLNQAVFWLSAILFDVNGLSEKAQKVLYFNPVTFIVEGYRNSLCRHVWFWEEPVKLGCYLFMMLVMGIVAVQMYRKLRKRMPDVI